MSEMPVTEEAVRTHSKSRFFVRSLTRDHLPGLTDLHQGFYGVSRDQSFWEWKYFERPVADHAMFVAEVDGRVVGQVGSVGYRAQIAGRATTVHQDEDILVDEGHRRGGTFFKLERALRDKHKKLGVPLDYGFSIELTRKVATKSLGFQDVVHVPKLVQVRSLRSYLHQKTGSVVIARLGAALFDPLLRWFNGKARARLPLGWRLLEIHQFDLRFDRLWERCRNDLTVAIVRDATYLDWRYGRNPVQDTLALAVADETGELQGFLVAEVKTGVRAFKTLGVRPSSAKRGLILDYLVAPTAERDRVLETLVAAAQEHFRSRKVEVISCWVLPHMPIYPLLRHLGFRQRYTPHHLIVRVDDPSFPGVQEALDPCAWYLTQGDKDHF